MIAVAHRRVSTVRPHRRARASLSESGLSLVGLVHLQDPPCPAYARTIAACHEAGIDVAPVTGDHRTKAANVATPAGIPANRQYVVARATPAGKLVLIQACHEAGHVIAMTGDEVNDGPALRRADIGVTMGERGTEVARQFADLLIGNDDLVTVIAAVEEGRRVYANIRRLLLYALSGGLRDPADAGRPAPGAPLSLLPAQIPWLSLLTRSFAGAAPGTEPRWGGPMACRFSDDRATAFDAQYPAASRHHLGTCPAKRADGTGCAPSCARGPLLTGSAVCRLQRDVANALDGLGDRGRCTSLTVRAGPRNVHHAVGDVHVPSQ